MKKALIILFILTGSGYIYSQNWCMVDSSFGTTVMRRLKVINNELYAMGAFSVKNTNPTIYSFAKWDGLSWQGFGSIQSNEGYFDDIELYNNRLYVGGGFNKIAGNSTIRKLSYYANSQWNKVGNITFGISATDEVFALQEYKGKLYIGGRGFTIGSSTNYNKILTWNDTVFAHVGGGINPSGSGEVSCMAVYNNELIVGGIISHAGTLAVNNIVRWDGSQWLKFPGDSVFNDGVGRMAVDTINNYLYIAPAYYEYSGNWAFSYLGRWDGSNWTFIKSPTQSFLGMYVHNTDLYVSGLAWGSDTLIAKWDGTNWELIFGPNDNVTAVTIYKDELYAGGIFTQVDTMNIVGIAKYGASCIVGEKIILGENYQLTVFPNPTKGTSIIKYALPKSKQGEIRIYNLAGELIKQYSLSPGINSIEVDTSKWAAGTYVYSLYIDNELKESSKLVVE